MKVIHVSGTRKTAKARATLKAGNGIIRINSQLLNHIEPKMLRMKIQEPLLIAGENAKKVDISVKTHGGGKTSQAEAARLAIARALVFYDKKLQKEFLNYDRHLLVADVRRKETHRPNTHGKARSRRQRSRR
ncbi:30S ribosomal protein S9 [Candidatus Woesearchaeota archaeon]|nr:30S ribosomal protein S9 [Candidatus Woesearchaeota archaeon]MBW2978530.1 30S ribosomal protein S9 [Candidatus Woesearchaeota archaeon]